MRALSSFCTASSSTSFVLALAVASLAACSEPKPAEPAPPPPPPPPPAMSSAPAPVVEAPKPEEKPVPEAPKGPTPAFKTGGFNTPESVYYDAEGDRYLVSNIGGKPTAVDNDGYISIVSPEGKVITEKWIAGGTTVGKAKITLNAPKGTVISKGLLYVADLDTVRMFDAKTGAPKGEVKIKDATFLNDVAAGPDGKIYVSDSGLKQNDKGDFEQTGTDAVYTVTKAKATIVAKDKSLGGPNGLYATKDGVWVVTFGSGELYRLDAKGKKSDAIKLPKGALDGIVPMGDMLFISSWEGSTVFKGKAAGPFEPVLTELKAPADIGLDTKRSRILVPRFIEGNVEAYDVKLADDRPRPAGCALAEDDARRSKQSEGRARGFRTRPSTFRGLAGAARLREERVQSANRRAYGSAPRGAPTIRISSRASLRVFVSNGVLAMRSAAESTWGSWPVVAASANVPISLVKTPTAWGAPMR